MGCRRSTKMSGQRGSGGGQRLMGGRGRVAGSRVPCLAGRGAAGRVGGGPCLGPSRPGATGRVAATARRRGWADTGGGGGGAGRRAAGLADGGPRRGPTSRKSGAKVGAGTGTGAYSFGAPAGVSCPGSGCTPGLEPFHGTWTRVKRPGFSSPPGNPVTLREARRGPVGTSSQSGSLNTLP